jgi:hypothetical protein
MNDIAYFGYGSLVNRQTRAANTRAYAVTLSGWVRQWKHCIDTPAGKLCALAAVPRDDAEIDGVVVLDDRAGLAATDRRELGYRRERVLIPRFDGDTDAVEGYIYVSNAPYNRWASEQYPIWRSYVDCVLAGYIDVWGEDGARRFIASTEGWDGPILDDRSAPKYPRAVQLEDALRASIDNLLEKVGIT